MKRNTIKAFTLVEMLIVIVIIGILIASLMPRMQTAQGRARDVARKNDLSQIQTAIITSQSDRASWPGFGNNKKDTEDATKGMKISAIDTLLLEAGMSSIPTDPNGSNVNYGLGETSDDSAVGEYIYVIAKRNGVPNAGFVLMAKTEVEGSSNWVTCFDSSGKAQPNAGTGKGYISNSDDLAGIELCKQVKEADTNKECSSKPDEDGICYYKQTGELRYILLY